MDFFAAATPCNPLGRSAQNDNVVFCLFYKRLKTTNSQIQLQIQAHKQIHTKSLIYQSSKQPKAQEPKKSKHLKKPKPPKLQTPKKP